MKIFSRYTPLQIAIHLYAWSAIIWIIIELLTNSFSFNPIQELEQRTGRHAITLLILSLVCSPVNAIFKWSEPLKRRRTLGLYAFMYVFIHLLIFVNLDYGLAWSSIAQTILEKPYIIYGFIAFLLLIPLAFTSFDIWKVRLGKNWKRLHKIIYIIAPIAVYHYALSKKGDIFNLSGDIQRPLIYALVLGIFLLLRISFIKKFFASLWTRILILFQKKNPLVEKPSSDSHL